MIGPKRSEIEIVTVGIEVGGIVSEVGSAQFLDAFFGTIHYHLEEDKWGGKYPILLNDLYQGKLTADKAAGALLELDAITVELAKFAPDEVIWDLNNVDTRPPWGDNISDEITDLSNYFVTSTGRDLIGTIRESIESMQTTTGTVLEIVSF